MKSENTTTSSLKRGFKFGIGVALGILTSSLTAVAVTGTIKSWSTGETLKSSDLNTTITSLTTAIESIPNWSKNGTTAYYTTGNVGIGTSTTNSKLSILASTQGLQVGTTDFTPISGTMFQVNGQDNSSSNFVAQFGSLNAGIRMSIRNDGAVSIPGSLSKGSGTFDIPHPDPSMPKDSHLRHSFVESPTAGDNIYRWQVKIESENGKSYIKLPKYWNHLNENPMIWVSSTQEPALAYGYINQNADKVIVQANKVGTYNVLLIGTRKDQLAVNNWKNLGMEYLAKGLGEAEKILSFKNNSETGVYLSEENSQVKKLSEIPESNEKLISDLQQRIDKLETILMKIDRQSYATLSKK